MVTPEQVAQARQEAADSEEFVDAVDILKKKGIVQEQELLAMLAQQYGMELLDLSHYDIPQEVIDSMSGDIALHYRVVPVMKHDNLLTIAMSDPTDMETLDTLRYLLGGDVDAVIAPQRQIDLQIAKHYSDETEQVNRFLGDANIADADMLIALSQALETPVSTLLGETVSPPAAEDMKAIAAKLEVVNLQLARRKRVLRWWAQGALAAVCAALLLGFVLLALWGSPYLGWDYDDPETAVIGVGLHVLEWIFVRAAPVLLIAAAAGIFLVRRKKTEE